MKNRAYYEVVAKVLKWTNDMTRYNSYEIYIWYWYKKGFFVPYFYSAKDHPSDPNRVIIFPRTGFGYKSLPNLLARLDKISLDKVSPNTLD